MTEEEAKTAVEVDFTDELKNKKPKISKDGLLNEIYGVDKYMEDSWKNLHKTIDHQYKNGNRLIARDKKGRFAKKVKAKKTGGIKLNGKEYIVNIDHLEAYEPVRDAFGRFAPKNKKKK